MPEIKMTEEEFLALSKEDKMRLLYLAKLSLVNRSLDCGFFIGAGMMVVMTLFRALDDHWLHTPFWLFCVVSVIIGVIASQVLVKVRDYLV